jgi:hypothetical protein
MLEATSNGLDFSSASNFVCLDEIVQFRSTMDIPIDAGSQICSTVPAKRPGKNIARQTDSQQLPSKDQVWASIGALNRSDIQQLGAYARYVLRTVGISPELGDDIVQSAALTVCVGASMTAKGRHPRITDLENRVVFLRYMRGVVRSLVNTQRELREHRYSHIHWDEDLQNAVVASSSLLDDVVFRDLTAIFAKRLSTRVPQRLQSVVAAWSEEKFDCDNIPVRGLHRRLRAEVRSTAILVFCELQSCRQAMLGHSPQR